MSNRTKLVDSDAEAAVILEGQLLSLSQAVRLLWMPRRNGRPIHVATLYRWATRGVKGVRLQTVMVGRTRCVTEQALHEFFDSLGQYNETQRSAPIRPQGQGQRNHAARRAREILHLGSTSKRGGGPDET